MPGIRASDYVATFTVPVPAGTPASAPVTVPTVLKQGELVGVDVIIPPGHAGLTGVQLYIAGAQAIPFALGEWISGDAETLEIPTTGYATTGAWAARGYNLGAYAHSFLVRYYVDTQAVFASSSSGYVELPPAAYSLLT